MGCLGAIYWLVVAGVAIALLSAGDTGPLFAIALVAGAFWFWRMLRPRTAGGGPSGTSATGVPRGNTSASAAPAGRASAGYTPNPPRGSLLEPWMPGQSAVEVVGEAYREEAFRRIFAGPAFNSEGGAEEYLPAVLTDDSANPHDGNAVAVWLKEQHVGYLDRDRARAWHPVVSQLAAQNQHLVVDARVWARDAGNRVHARVTLYLPPRDGVWPANAMPEEVHVVLPQGGQVQVTQEDRHMEVLAPYARGGDVPVAVTLHAVTEQRPRSTVTVVEVRLDGGRVGVLSPTQTANLLPLVERVADRGVQSVAKALVRGNELKADVILFVTKAQEVDPLWLRFLDSQGRQPRS